MGWEFVQRHREGRFHPRGRRLVLDLLHNLIRHISLEQIAASSDQFNSPTETMCNLWDNVIRTNKHTDTRAHRTPEPQIQARYYQLIFEHSKASRNQFSSRHR